MSERKEYAMLERVAAIAAIAALTACASGAAPSAVAPATMQRTAGRVAVTFTIKWNATTARARAYVPTTARSVSVAVNGGTPQYLNAPATALVIDAAVGTDTFAIATYDEQNGQGSVLSRAFVTQAIVAGTANTVAATLNGVVASVALTLAAASPNAGVPSTTAVGVAAKDADGNTIVGGADYATPIHLAISDPSNSGTLALSTPLVANPGTSVTLAYTGGTLASGLPGAPLATIVATATGVPTATTAFTPTPTVYTYALPSNLTSPIGIAAGPDGNMWFTEFPRAVGRITPAGVVTEFPIPSPDPTEIVAVSDGNLWFAGTGSLGRITTAGSVSLVGLGNDRPDSLADRGGGSLWYLSGYNASVGFYDITFQFGSANSLPAVSAPGFIATGADGNGYFTDTSGNRIGRITHASQIISQLTLAAGTTPEQIVSGPDGNLWFCERDTSRIGRLAPSSFTVTGDFPTLLADALPTALATGADGAIWYAESRFNRIARITTDGASQVDFALPSTVTANLEYLATARDGSLWFTAGQSFGAGGTVGKLVY